MADYKISIGTELRTNGIDSKLKEYDNKKVITFKSALDDSGLNSDILGYTPPKNKVINFTSKLNTQGVTNKIEELKSKEIKIAVDPDFTGVASIIENKEIKTPFKVKTQLSWAGVAAQISKPTLAGGATLPKLSLDVKIDDSAISDAITTYQKDGSIKTVPVKITPDFSSLDFAKAEELLKGYEAKTPLKAHVLIQKGSINKQIEKINKDFMSNLRDGKANSMKVFVNAEFRENAILSALNSFRTKHAAKLVMPIDLTVNSGLEDNNLQFDSALKAKIESYENKPIRIPVQLRKASKGFDANITKTPITVEAELAPDAINAAIANAKKNLSKLPVGVSLTTKDVNDINKQIGQLKALATEKLPVDIEIDKNSANIAIALFQPTATLGVKPDLILEDTDAQIEKYVPKVPLKVKVLVDNNDIDEKTGEKNPQEPINVNVRLNPKSINSEIADFKPTSKLKVPVELDFKTHKDKDTKEIIQKGFTQQIRDFEEKTKTKLNVGVELNKASVDSAIESFKTDVPIKLDVELNTEPAEKRIEELREEFKKFGNITINFNNPDANGANNSTGNSGGGSGSVGNNNIPKTTKDFDALTASVTNANGVVGAMDKALGDLGVKLNSTGAIAATKDIQEMGIEVQKVTTAINGTTLTMSITGIQETENGIKRVVTETKKYQDAVANPENISKRFTQTFRTSADAAKEVAIVFKDVYKTKQQIGELEVELIGAKAKDDKDRISAINDEIDRLKSKLNTLDEDGIYSSKFTDKQNAVLEEQKKLIDYQKKHANSVVSDNEVKQEAKKEAKEVNDIYSDIYKTKSRINSLKAESLVKDPQKDAKEIKAINDEVTRLENNLKALKSEGYNFDAKDGIYSSKFTDKQNASLKELDEQGVYKTSRATGKADDKAALKQQQEEAKKINEAFNEIYKTKKRIGDLETELVGAKADGDLDRVKEINKEVTRLKANLKSLGENGFDSSKFSNNQNAVLAELDKQNEYNISHAESRVSDLKKKLEKEIVIKISEDEFEKDISNIETRLKRLGNVGQSDDLSRNIKNLKTNKTQMENAINSGEIEKAIKAHKRYIEYKKAVENELKIKENEQSFVNEDFKNLEKVASKLDKIKQTLAGLDENVDVNRFAELSKQLNDVQAEYNELYAEINGKLTDSQKAKLYINTEDAERELNDLKAKIDDTKAKLANKIRVSIEVGNADKQGQDVLNKINKIKEQTVETQVAIEQYNAALTNMRDVAKNGSNEELIRAQIEYERALKAVNNQLDINISKERKKAERQKLEDDRTGLQTRIDAWLKKNSAAANKFGDRLREIKAQAQNCDRVTLDHLEAEFKQIDKEAEAAGKRMQSWTDRFKSQLQKYSAYFSVASLFMRAEQAARSMFEQVKLIDSAMTELKKVTNETNYTYNEFLTNAAKRSKELGTTIDGYISSTADFARLGYGFEDAQGLAEVANIYAVVGDEIEGVEDATQSLVSTLAAFKDEMNGMNDADFAMSIVDKMNEVSNNFAISSGGIGEALQRSASSMAAANNSLDETIAMITAANTVAQNPEKVGNAFKTMSMRIRGAKTELEEAGESTEGMASSTASLRQEIMALSGVDIMLDKNTFKSTYQIMDELSNKWEDLSDIAQASIIELVAGKHQGNVFASLMSNFDIAREALDTSLGSSGSAMSEHAKWSQSLEARLNKLKAAWQSLSQSFMDSDSLKVVLDIVIKLAEALDSLLSNVGLLPTLFAGFTSFKAIKSSIDGKGLFRILEDEANASSRRIVTLFNKNLSGVSFENLLTDSDFSKSLQADIDALDDFANKYQAANGNLSEEALGNIFKNASDKAREFAESGRLATDELQEFIDEQISAEVATMAQNKSLSNAMNIMREYNNNCGNVGLTQQQFIDAVRQSNPVMANYLSGLNGARAGMAGYIRSLTMATIKTVGLQVVTAALNGVISLIASAAISFAIKKIDEMHVSAEELAQEVDELTEKFKEQHNELVKLKNDYDTSNEDSMISKYEKLSKGVGTLGENISLTADEYSEYQEIANKIAEQIPSLIVGYDEQGNAILSCKDNVSALIAEYEKLLHTQNQEILKSENYEKIEEDFENAMSEARSNDAGLFKVKASINEINALEGLLKSNNLAEDIPKIVEDYGANFQYLIKALENNGIKMKVGEHSHDFVKRALTDNRDIVQRIVNDFNANLDAETEGMKSAAQAALSEAFDFSDSAYTDIGDKTQLLIRQIVGSFDAEKFDEIKQSGKTVEQYINGMLDKFKYMSASDATKLEASFDLKTKFNNGEISYGEYLNGLTDISNLLTRVDLGDAESQIRLSLNMEEVAKNHSALKSRLTSEEYGIEMDAAAADKFLSELNNYEYSVAVKLIADGEIDLSNFDAESLRQYIADEAKILEAMSFSPSIEVDKTSLEALNTALEESASAMGLSSESISALESKYSELESYEPSELFERTANGVKVNREEVEKLEKEQRELTKSKVAKHLETLINAYNDTTKAIDETTNAADRAKLLGERDKYAAQIRELSEYQAQLEGITGAYQRWLDAQEGPEDYEGYEGVATGWKDVAEEIGRGFIGNKSKAFIDLLSGKGLEGGTIDDYFNAWKELDDKVTSAGYSVKDFFTLDDDGNMTAQGIDRFFESMQKDFNGSVAKFDKETEKWLYDFSEENLKAIQDKYGIGIEAISLLLEAADPAGYNVNWDGLFDDLDLDVSNFETILSYAEKAQKEFNKLEGIDDVSFNFKTDNVEDATSELKNARSAYIDLITNDDGKINLDADGAEEMRVMLSALLIQKQQLEDSNIVMSIDTSKLKDGQEDIGKTINTVINFRNKYKNLEIAVSTGEGIEEAKTELDTAMTELRDLGEDGVGIAAQLIYGESTDPSVLITNLNAAIKACNGSIDVGCNLDGNAIGTLNNQLETNFTPEATVKITGIDDEVVGEYQSVGKTAEGTVSWSNDDSLVVEFQEKVHQASGKVNWINNTVNVKKSFSATGTVTWTSGNNVKVTVVQTAEVDGTANVNGTAFANGTAGRAFKNGDWGIKGSGTALVGELGMETLVRDGHFYTIGDNGAEFVNYKPGDIIFNHKQTEELFKNGKVTSGGGRGRAMAEGTVHSPIGKAFIGASASGSDFAANRVTGKTYTSSDSSSSSSNTDNANESAEEFQETLDWIEILINRIERAISRLDTKASSIFRSWSERTNALNAEISNVNKEIEIQQQAYDKYIEAAEASGLSAEYAAKVRNGEIDIETIKDEELKQRIDDYKEYYEKALDCQDAVLELKEKESELYKQRFDNVSTQYEGYLAVIEHEKNMLEGYINQAEAQSWLVSSEYYDALANNERKNIAELESQKAAMIAELNASVDSGAIEVGSEAWYEMVGSIDEVTLAIQESNTSLLEYSQTIQQLSWEVFDLLQDKISSVTEESEFLIDLISNSKLFDDNGQLTNEGNATMGLHGQNYNVYMAQADQAAEEAARLKKELETDPYDTELEERYREMVSLQQEYILAAEDEKEAIRDLVEEGIELEIEALEERIDKYNEALNSQKDLYEYQKKVKEQTEEIASLEKQMSAYEGDDSEETRQKIQQIKVDLENARTELEETEYDKYISDTEQMLDALTLEYQEVLNMRLDNVDALLTDMINGVNANADSISSTISEKADSVGYTLSDSMQTIWTDSSKVITTYGDRFLNAQTSTNNALDMINKNLQKMISNSNSTASQNTQSSSTSSAGVSNTTSSSNSSSTNSTSGGDGKPKVGDKVKFVSGQYYYDSEGKNPLGTHKQGDYVYITKINSASWATHPYHISTGSKLGDGDLGWLKLNQISGYATGKKNFYNNEIAWTQENGKEFIVRPSDGAILTPIAKGDSVLTSIASKNIWDMANSPADFIKDNLNLGSSDIPNNSNSHSNYTQYLDKVVFSLPNVKNYDEMLHAMQKDKNFERLIHSMSIDRLAGKSSLAKGKAIR